jgi:hypothetical protein
LQLAGRAPAAAAPVDEASLPAHLRRSGVTGEATRILGFVHVVGAAGNSSTEQLQQQPGASMAGWGSTAPDTTHLPASVAPALAVPTLGGLIGDYRPAAASAPAAEAEAATSYAEAFLLQLLAGSGAGAGEAAPASAADFDAAGAAGGGANPLAALLGSGPGLGGNAAHPSSASAAANAVPSAPQITATTAAADEDEQWEDA